jgi:1,4-dihydroxy-2-naphthoate octaprenyltransferase
VRQGLLPHFRFGGSLRVQESDLEAFIDQQRASNGQAPTLSEQPPTASDRAKAWLEIVRPFAWTASLVPVALGATLAWRDDAFDGALFALVLGAALTLQAGTNVINEVFDVRNEVDTADSPRASKVLLQGRMEASEAYRGALVLLGITAVIGGYLIAVRGPAMLAIGSAGLLGGYFYTAPPLHYKYRALGVPLVFVLMGPLMVFGAYYAISGHVTVDPWLIAIPAGLLVAAILHANDVRDVDDDRNAGFRTLSTIIGQERGAIFYIGLVLGAYAVVVILAGTGTLPWWALLTLITLPGSVAAIRAITAGAGLRGEVDAAAGINRIDLMSAQTHMTFGLLLTLALVLEEATF